MININCCNCKKGLVLKPSRIKKAKSISCSIRCRGEYKSREIRSNVPKEELYKLYFIDKKSLQEIAEIYNKSVSMIKLYMLWNGFKTRSSSHTAILRNSFSKEKNPNWKGGKTRWHDGIYSSRLYKEWRNHVLKRDNYICSQCKDNKGHNLQAHHLFQKSKYLLCRYIFLIC